MSADTRTVHYSLTGGQAVLYSSPLCNAGGARIGFPRSYDSSRTWDRVTCPLCRSLGPDVVNVIEALPDNVLIALGAGHSRLGWPEWNHWIDGDTEAEEAYRVAQAEWDVWEAQQAEHDEDDEDDD